MLLETPRLILRPFAADDLDRMAELMANKDFMRFSMGPMTREQTQSFLDKVIGWDRDGLPSQFAMIVRSSGREKWNDPGRGNNFPSFSYFRLRHYLAAVDEAPT
jgi:RimJ/RimL family protein N-acetyltransferase